MSTSRIEAVRKRPVITALAVGVVATVAVVVAFGASGRLTAGDDDRPVIHLVGPIVDSIEELVQQADVIVVGEVTGVTGREIDRGGDPEVDPESGEEIPGVPVMFVGVRVDESLRGDVDVDQQLDILRLDTGEVLSADESDLGDGDRFVFFLEHVSAPETPGILTVDGFYNTVGGEDGVFEIVGERGVNRGEVTALWAVDVLTDWEQDYPPPLFELDMTALRAFVESQLQPTG